jgi:hypothetical protein
MNTSKSIKDRVRLELYCRGIDHLNNNAKLKLNDIIKTYSYSSILLDEQLNYFVNSLSAHLNF